MSLTGWVLDALAIVLAYLAVLAIWERLVRQDDLVAVGALVALSFPGATPFGRMSGADVRRLLARWGVLLLALSAFAAWADKREYAQAPGGRYFLVAWGLVAFSAVLLTRLASPWALRALGKQSKTKSVVIVGVSDAALRLGQAISLGQGHGQRLAGFFDDRAPERACVPSWGLRLGGLGDVGEFVKRHRIERIYIALPVSSSARMIQLLQQTQDTTASVYLVPNLSMADTIQCRVSLLAGVPMVAMCESPFQGVAGALKRTLDVTLTLAAMPLLLPLMGVLAVLVRTSSSGPVIFKQRRYGLDGQEILVWKFRTMTTVEDGCTSATYRQATANDERVTPLGRLLRKSSLDELPQFFNVLMGTMSIVGPRPHALAVNEECRKLIPRYMLRHKVKPGITGWAQVNGCRGGDDLAALQRRTECDIQYLKTWSLGLDVLIMWKTILLLLRGDKNAY